MEKQNLWSAFFLQTERLYIVDELLRDDWREVAMATPPSLLPTWSWAVRSAVDSWPRRQSRRASVSGRALVVVTGRAFVSLATEPSVPRTHMWEPRMGDRLRRGARGDAWGAGPRPPDLRAPQGSLRALGGPLGLWDTGLKRTQLLGVSPGGSAPPPSELPLRALTGSPGTQAARCADGRTSRSAGLPVLPAGTGSLRCVSAGSQMFSWRRRVGPGPS